MDRYVNETKEIWGCTEAYAEFSEKSKDYSKERFDEINAGLDRIMGEFASCMLGGSEPSSPEAQALTVKLQSYISEHYYTCTESILSGLGQMYTADERFRKNIDRHAEGTAEFISSAIRSYCGR